MADPSAPFLSCTHTTDYSKIGLASKVKETGSQRRRADIDIAACRCRGDRLSRLKHLEFNLYALLRMVARFVGHEERCRGC